MIWSIIDNYHLESDLGYRVAKTFGADAPIYLAFAPQESLDGKLKQRYGSADTVPQRRRILGAYSCAKTAKAACEKHINAQRDDRAWENA